MNNLKQEIMTAFLTTASQLEKCLQASGVIIVVRDINHQLVYANAEFSKPLSLKTGEIQSQPDNIVLPETFHQLFCEREKTVLANGKPLIIHEQLPFATHHASCSCVYFPIKNTADETLGTGMFAIPVQQENTVSVQVCDTTSETSSEDDPLTGIPNRQSMTACYEEEIALADKTGKNLTIVLINIDDFSSINEDWGRPTGDVVLVEFCELIKNHLRSSDRLGRWSDNEFILILPDTNVFIGSQIAERIRTAVEHRHFQKAITVTASFGVAVHDRGETVEDSAGRADTAVFVAKMNGKNKVEVDRAGMNDLTLPNLKASNFLKLVWKHEYECGNALIDDQHRLLFYYSNRLLAAIFDAQPKEHISTLINQLLAHTQSHFEDEEKILRKIGYEDVDEHALIHQELVQKAIQLSVRFEDDKLEFDEIFHFLTNEVVIEHMLQTDIKFFPFFSETQK